MASGRKGLLPSGREPGRRRASLRIHGDLCLRLRRGGAAEASAAAQGAGAVCRGEESRRAHQAALAGAAGGRGLRLGEGAGGLRRDLPAHGLAAGTRLQAVAEYVGARGERVVRAAAELVAQAAPAPGVGDGRRPGAVDTRRRCAAGLRREGRPGRRAPVAGRAEIAARRRRRPGAAQGPVGGGGPRQAAPGHRALGHAATPSRRR